MTVKLLVLKPKQDVIADISEIRTQPDPEIEGDEGRVVGYQLRHPYVITLSKIMNEVENPGNDHISVNISRWNPYSVDTKYQIPSEMVNVICEPVPRLVETWQEKVDHEETIIKQMTEPQPSNTVVQQELLNEESTDSDTEE